MTCGLKKMLMARAGLDVASVQRAGSDTFRLFIAGTERPAYALHDPPLLRYLGLHAATSPRGARQKVSTLPCSAASTACSRGATQS